MNGKFGGNNHHTSLNSQKKLLKFHPKPGKKPGKIFQVSFPNKTNITSEFETVEEV